MNYLRIKNLAEVRENLGKTALVKNLGALDLFLLGLGGIIGTGIFVLTGLAAAKFAGPAITLSFPLGAIACVFTALAYSELAAMLPTSGSAYTYAYVSLGEGFAALIGCLLLMLFTFGTCTVAAGWSGYVMGIIESFGIHLPPALTKIPSQGGYINLPAVCIILLLTFLLIRGTKEATRLNGILVFVKLAAIFWFLFAAFPHASLHNWDIFAPNGFTGIAAGAGFVFMAYTGFDTLSTAAEECRNPNRDLPIGIIGSLLGSALLYIIVSGMLTAIVPYTSLNNAEPMAYALRENGVQIGAKLVATGAVAGMTTVILTQIYGQSRILLVMSRDGMMPKLFSKVSKKYGTPHIGLVLSGILMAIIAGFMPVATLGQLASMSTLAVFASVSIGVMVIRYKYPNEKRPFRCPAIYWVASASTLLCFFLLAQLLPENWIPFTLSMGTGIITYFFYGYRHSTMNRRSSGR